MKKLIALLLAGVVASAFMVGCKPAEEDSNATTPTDAGQAEKTDVNSTDAGTTPPATDATTPPAGTDAKPGETGTGTGTGTDAGAGAGTTKPDETKTGG
jgi:hypothetical protein